MIVGGHIVVGGDEVSYNGGFTAAAGHVNGVRADVSGNNALGFEANASGNSTTSLVTPDGKMKITRNSVTIFDDTGA